MADPPEGQARIRTSEISERADRLTEAESSPLRPDSLVGSSFLSRADPGWQGVVVAEPAPGVYLVQLFSWLDGSPTDQQLIPIAEMQGWRFYDTSEQMVEHYERNVAGVWERERKDAGLT